MVPGRIVVLLCVCRGVQQFSIDVRGERVAFQVRVTMFRSGIVPRPVVVFHHDDPHVRDLRWWIPLGGAVPLCARTAAGMAASNSAITAQQDKDFFLCFTYPPWI